jgi:D-alanyl-D-alanine carboxypeptidase/D-alanyl-D-alanine-endopeptidase (penicillin-binding protein 4)
MLAGSSTGDRVPVSNANDAIALAGADDVHTYASSARQRLRSTVFASLVSLPLLAGCAAQHVPAVTAVRAPTYARSLPAELDAIIAAAPSLKGSQFALTVRDANSGATLYERNAEQRLIPASTLKLLISAAALDTLGLQYQFSTSVSATGSVKDGVLRGDLYLRGTGDPTLQVKDYAGLAAQVASFGIHTVTGNLVFDDTWFDSELMAPGWTQDDESFAFDAPISALTVSPDGKYAPATVDIELEAGAALGAPLRVTMTPSNGYLEILNAGLTGTSNTLTVTREHGLERVVVRGMLPIDGGLHVQSVSVGNPSRYVADLFRRALRDQKVQVNGLTVIGKATPADATPVTEHLSIPLSAITQPFLKESINGYAESITKALGRASGSGGSWAAGIGAIAKFLHDDGIDYPLRQVDGSGLSRYNSISSRTLSDLLIDARRKPWFDTWYAALPVAGNADPSIGGTLRNRMRGTAAENNAHAKTGSMSGVSGLSGYVTDAAGNLLAFSMLTNNAVESVKSVEDAIVVELATSRSSLPACASSASPMAFTLNKEKPCIPFTELERAFRLPT